MSRGLKLLLVAVGAVLVLMIAITVAVVVLFDPNEYRDEISAAVEEQTGREFSIDGEIGLRAFPCCAVAVDGVRLGNPAGFGDEAFASANSVGLGVQLLPLLFNRKVVVDEVTLDGLDVKLSARKPTARRTGRSTPAPRHRLPKRRPKMQAVMALRQFSGAVCGGREHHPMRIVELQATTQARHAPRRRTN